MVGKNLFIIVSYMHCLWVHQVRQLLEREDGHVIATCRDPDSAGDLSSLKDRHSNRLTVLPLDVTKETTIEVSYARVINCMALLHLRVGFVCGFMGLKVH